MDASKLTDNYAVAAQVQPDDVAGIAAAGFVAVICNRPDNEEPGQPSASEIAAECDKHGLAFHHIPISGMPVPQAAIQALHDVVENSDGPVLGYCRSGQRSMILWQASA